MNKLKLKELIKLVSDLSQYKDLRWFKDELIKNLTGGNKLVNTNQVQDYINIRRLIIDYSKIDDEKIKEQLKIDCTLMYRHKFGLVVVKREGSDIDVLNEGKINENFNQFCIHAHYQVEQLINYFLKQKYKKGTFYKVDQGVHTSGKIIAVKVGKKYYFGGNVSNESELVKVNTSLKGPIYHPSFSDKFNFITNNHFRVKKEYNDVLHKIRLIRNNIIHRNETTNKKTVEKEFQDLLKELLNSIDPDTNQKYTYEDLIKWEKRIKNDKLKKYNELNEELQMHEFKSKQDYPIVIETLEFLKDKIIEHL